jgi:hypothetical protein
MIAALALIILSGTGAAVSLSNSGGGTWKYQREISMIGILLDSPGGRNGDDVARINNEIA